MRNLVFHQGLPHLLSKIISSEQRLFLYTYTSYLELIFFSDAYPSKESAQTISLSEIIYQSP